MLHEGLADSAGGVVTGGDEDGVFRKVVNENNQELVASSLRQRSYNVDRVGIPGSWDWMVPVVFWRWP